MLNQKQKQKILMNKKVTFRFKFENSEYGILIEAPSLEIAKKNINKQYKNALFDRCLK